MVGMGPNYPAWWIERAVLKHFPHWPERKADALREAACSYRELKSLESEVLSFKDNPNKQLLSQSLRKIQAFARQASWKEVLAILRELEMARASDTGELHIPWAWMLDTGVVWSVHGKGSHGVGNVMNRLKNKTSFSPRSKVLLIEFISLQGDLMQKTVKAFEGIKLISTNIESQYYSLGYSTRYLGCKMFKMQILLPDMPFRQQIIWKYVVYLVISPL
nr:protein CHUP1, chloroplastic [Ipomoea batatas]